MERSRDVIALGELLLILLRQDIVRTGCVYLSKIQVEHRQIFLQWQVIWDFAQNLSAKLEQTCMVPF